MFARGVSQSSRFAQDSERRIPALTERRDSNARPFKCPKNAYGAVAAVIAQSKVPVGF